jgi:hypothetical protein
MDFRCLLDVTPCSMVECYQCFEAISFLHPQDHYFQSKRVFRPEDRGSRHLKDDFQGITVVYPEHGCSGYLRNVGNIVPDCMASRPKCQ